jgi:zinc and cadmium transporter
MILSNTFWAVLLASFLACAVTTVGIIVISRYEKWGTDNAAYFMSFAAGVLISVSFIHIIPKVI